MKYKPRSAWILLVLALVRFWVRVLGKRGLIGLTIASTIAAIILEQKL